MAATNRPDVLDSALLRPGRFDRHVTVDRPTWQGRLAILKVHTRNKPLADDVNLEEIARDMIGMTGADLRNLANEAALVATRENKSRIDAGFRPRRRSRVDGPQARRSADGRGQDAARLTTRPAMRWSAGCLPGREPPHKVTIIPRGQALGVTFTCPTRTATTTASITARPGWR